MIVVKVELWPHGHAGQSKELSRMYIANTGGTATRGEYKAALMREGEYKPPWEHGEGGQDLAAPIREYTVGGHARQADHVVTLVAKCVQGMYPRQLGEPRTTADVYRREQFPKLEARIKELEQELADAKSAAGEGLG